MYTLGKNARTVYETLKNRLNNIPYTELIICAMEHTKIVKYR